MKFAVNFKLPGKQEARDGLTLSNFVSVPKWMYVRLCKPTFGTRTALAGATLYNYGRIHQKNRNASCTTSPKTQTRTSLFRPFRHEWLAS